MKILILQYQQPRIDTLALEATERRYFVGLMSGFNDHDVRFRLHPASKARQAYKDMWPGLRFDNESRPLYKSLGWPDIVIGPAISGAMLESIAHGKRTFMVLLPPHSCNFDYFRGAHLCETVQAVHSGIKAGLTPDHSEFFERYTARKQFPDPVREIWRALAA